MTIAEQQWNKLNDEQKNSFQDEVCKKFGDREYPSYGDIDLFFQKKEMDAGINDLGDEETPKALKEINDLWERVLAYFNSNK